MAQAAAREARIAAEQAAKATEVVAAQSAANQAVDEVVSVPPDSDEQPAS
jgi:hypothetical protein